MSTKLTEKKLADRRFRKTEEAIFKVFFDDKGGKNSVSELVQKIGVDRATFYRHHCAVDEILGDYEEYILEKYRRLVQEIRERNETSLRRIYYEMLVFILQNRGIFDALIKKESLKVIRDAMLELRPEIENYVRLSNGFERVLRVYIGEVEGLIVDWGLNEFKEAEMVKLLNNMMYLTKTARERLLPLAN